MPSRSSLLPELFSSEYSIHTEWNYLATNDKPVFPVMLERIDSRDMSYMVSEKTDFSMDSSSGGEPCSFAEGRGRRKQRHFVEALFLQIERRLDKFFAERLDNMSTQKRLQYHKYNREAFPGRHFKAFCPMSMSKRLNAILPKFDNKIMKLLSQIV